MTAQISENLMALMDEINSIKLYQGADDKLYYAEVVTLTGSYFDCADVAMESLLTEVRIKIKQGV